MTNAMHDIRVEGPAPSVSAETLSALGKRSFVETFGHLYAESDLQTFLREEHGVEAYQRFLDDPAFAIWSAFDADGAAIGYLVAGPCHLPVDNMPVNSGELIRFYILGEFQGTGLGGRMMSDALVWLEREFDHVFLSVYRENVGAQRFYARYGFRKVQEYFFMVGDHADPEFIFKKVSQR